MSRRWLLLSLSLVGAPGGCDLPVGSNEESEELEALQAARAKADVARYLVALDTACCDRDGNRLRQRLQFAPRLTQISQNGRVVLWQRLARAAHVRSATSRTPSGTAGAATTATRERTLSAPG